MDAKIPQPLDEVHILPEAEIERLELLALASAALIAHAEKLEREDDPDAAARRAA